MIKILFADDDLKYSMLLKSFLQQHGYDVTYAGNGKKAWEQFPEVKPDLVLLDINMPEMDGYEVAERIRAIDPKVLIFFLTDRTEKNDRLKGFSLKANEKRRCIISEKPPSAITTMNFAPVPLVCSLPADKPTSSVCWRRISAM